VDGCRALVVQNYMGVEDDIACVSVPDKVMIFIIIITTIII
jgi:hypothetical protein